MSAPADVLVVGASAAGLGTVEALRRKRYSGRVTVLGAEPHPPYDRPPLSKQVLSGAWEPGRTHLRPTAELEALDAEFVLGDPAVALDAATRTVRTQSGRVWQAEAVVLATGLRPRAFPGQAALAGVHVLRTLDDALALRAELLAARQVVIVGDGVLGAEIAATARSMSAVASADTDTGTGTGTGTGSDTTVTLVGPQAAPLAAQLGPRVGALLARLHTENGVTLRLGAAVDGLTDHQGTVTGVRLATGEVLPAQVVVVAIGAVPQTEWLADSGLRLENGVVCDSYCRAADGIYAVGDVARWQHETLGALVRLENRTNAAEQAGAVAANLLGENRPYVPVPYFWTDQFAAKIQVHGVLSPDAEVSIVDGAEEERRFVALYRRHGKAIGVLGWNMPKQARLHRQSLIDGSADLAH